MKNHVRTISVLLLGLSLLPASAQMGGRGGGGGMGGPKGPDMGGAMAKVFGENSSFTATMEMQGADAPKGTTMKGKISCDSGKSRYEVNMAESGAMSAKDAADLKASGMDRMTMIARPDKKVHYMIFPGMQGYVEMAMKNADATKPASDFKIETTELGKETVDGHPCVKNKVVVADDQGKKSEFTVWNATDLKKFPVKLETAQEGQKMTLLFKDIKLAKPEAALFEPPADCKKYNDFMSMMMSRMGGMGGMGGGE
jgi:hypothetical protein